MHVKHQRIITLKESFSDYLFWCSQCS